MAFGAIAAAFAATAAASAAVDTAWIGPSIVDSGLSAVDPQVAMNSHGDAVAVWWEGNQSWSALYTPGGWAAPQRLNTDHEFALQVIAPQVDLDESGRAAASWLEIYDDFTNGTTWASAWAALYLPGAGWQAEHYIGLADWNIGDTPTVAIGLGGRVFVTYLDSSDANITYERCAMYVPGTSWQPPTAFMDNSSGLIPSYAQIVGDELAVAVAWNMLSPNFTSPEVFGATYSVAGGWSAPHRIDMGLGESGLFDVDIAGGVARFLLIDQAAGSGRLITLTRWSVADGWGAAQTVAGPLPKILRGAVASDAGGNVTVTWTNDSDLTTRDLYGRYYGAATGWDAPALLETVPGKVVGRGVPAPDKNGGAISVFQIQASGTNTTYWVRYVPGVGWRAAQQFYTTDFAVAGLALGSSPEYALALWYQDILSEWHVQAFELLRDDVEPTVVVTAPVETLLNTSAVHFEGSTDPAARAWVDGAPLALDSFGNLAFDRTLADGTYSYVLRAVDDDLNEFTVTVTFTIDTVSNLVIGAPANLSLETVGVFATISGTAEPGAFVTVGGVAAPVTGSGSFSYLAPLVFGLNRFEVVSVDPAGNRVNATVDVRQVLPDFGIDEARAQIANLTANLSIAVANLGAAQARLTLAEGNATALRAQLEAATAAAANATLEAQAANDAASAAEQRAKDSQAAAGNANTLAFVGVALGAVGILVGLLALMRGRKPAEAQLRVEATEKEPRPPK